MSNIITAPQATSPLSVWLSYLEHLHSSAIDMGLERVGKVGQLLNVLRPAPKVITVSGTNGKGTTCHMLESILMASGLKVGFIVHLILSVIPSVFAFKVKSFHQLIFVKYLLK